MNSNLSDSQNSNWFKKTLSTAKYFMVFGIIASIIGVGVLSGVFFAWIDTAGQIDPGQLKLTDSVTILYDINQKEVESIYGIENREWVDISDVPIYLQQAFISIEDERFYKHNGIDLRRIAGAILETVKTGGKSSHGASTITQQLVRNLTGEVDRTPKRKIQEQWRAIQLEKTLSKQQILEYYLNVIPLSNNVYGVQSAAKTFFNKDVKDLTLAESAAIAGITNAPTYYDPLRNPQNTIKREKLILAKMEQLGYIDDKQYEEALAEKLDFKKNVITKISRHSYFADQVIEDVVKDLQDSDLHYSQAYALKLIYGGGLKIYTTMDGNVQEAMDKVYTDESNFIKTNSKAQPQSGMVIIDPKTGQVRGIVGGIGQKKDMRGFDRATQSLRQPGSSIKPIAVYAPGIEFGKITPSTIIDDAPITIGNWSPSNYDFKYRGPVTVKTAITNSLNTVAVRILQRVGIDNSYNFLKKLGISSLKSSDRDYAPLSLGALSNGVSPLEMAAAYVPFVNNGIYIKPYTYTKVVDKDGKILLEKRTSESRVVMSEFTAYTMVELLQNVVNYGTGTMARLSNMPAAGKTGTASDMKDKWFVGFTPYYVGAVWYGYDQPSPLPSSTWNSALTTWKKVMEGVHKNLPQKGFSPPSGYAVDVAICTLTGERATSLCYKDVVHGSTVEYRKFKPGTEPTKYCSVHQEIKICTTSNQIATEYCPKDEVVVKSVDIRDYRAGKINLQTCTMHGPSSSINNSNNGGRSGTDKPYYEPNNNNGGNNDNGDSDINDILNQLLN